LAANVMSATAESPPVALPALTAHFARFEALVPHVPLPVPTLPVVTLNLKVGNVPVALIVA